MCVTIRGLIFQDFVNEACLYYPMPHFDLNKIQFTLIFIFILICCIPSSTKVYFVAFGALRLQYLLLKLFPK